MTAKVAAPLSLPLLSYAWWTRVVGAGWPHRCVGPPLRSGLLGSGVFEFPSLAICPLSFARTPSLVDGRGVGRLARWPAGAGDATTRPSPLSLAWWVWGVRVRGSLGSVPPGPVLFFSKKRASALFIYFYFFWSTDKTPTCRTINPIPGLQILNHNH